MKLSYLILSAILLVSSALAQVHEFHWNATWINANPDGVFERPVISCNGQFPWPTITIDKGDTMLIYMTNGLDAGDVTTLHFHALYEHGTNLYDGPPGVASCNIAPGDTMVYNITVSDQVGTFWYHSHSSGQYMDGLRGVLVVRDPDPPYEYDEEVVLTVSDWYHQPLSQMKGPFLSRYNPTGAEPIPQNLLFNDSMNATWHVKPDTTYLLRIINIGAFITQYLWMEDHEFEIIAVDSYYVKKNTTDLLYITSGQRYDVLVHTKNETDRNYAFMQRFDTVMLDTIPDDLILNRTNYIVYDDDADSPDEFYRDDLDYFDDFYLSTYDEEELLGDPDVFLQLDIVMDNLNDGVNYAFFNNITYLAPKVPTLGTVMSSGDLATNEAVYGTNTNTHVINEGDIIELLINNNDTGSHPMHLHAHYYQIIERGPDYSDSEDPVPWNSSAEHNLPEFPVMRETAFVRPQSWMRLRFKANNPGVWFFHCQVTWHLMQGLAVVFVEDPQNIQENQNLTDNWINVCKNDNELYEGNAAGNTVNFLDLTGQPVQIKKLPAGFTAKGIVALVFSSVAGFLGIVMIGIYGMADIPNIEAKVFADLDIESRELLADTDDEYHNEHEMVDLSKDASAKGSDKASHSSGAN